MIIPLVSSLKSDLAEKNIGPNVAAVLVDRSCYLCGAALVCSRHTLELTTQAFPGHAIMPTCAACAEGIDRQRGRAVTAIMFEDTELEKAKNRDQAEMN